MLVAAGAGGYFYWSKKNAATDSVVATSDTAATQSGKAGKNVPAPRQEVPPITSPSASMAADPLKTAKSINDQLRAAGLTTVIANVDDRLHATLGGVVTSNAAREKAVTIARAQEGVAGVNADAIEVAASKEQIAAPAPRRQPQAVAPPVSVQRDPAKLEGELGRSLRASGINGISAQVSDDFVVTLKGSVTSDAEKERAFGIARRFEGVKAVKDKVFVVTQ